jgi:Ca2+-binding RTX toxin-like protein
MPQYLFDRLDLSQPYQPQNLQLTPDGSNLPEPIPGALDIEIFTQVAGQIAPGYQGSALALGAAVTPAPFPGGEYLVGPSSLQLLDGDYAVTDPFGVGNRITLGSGTQRVSAGPRDTIVGGSGAGTIQAVGSVQMTAQIGSAGGSDTIFTGPGDTVLGGSDDAVIGGNSGVVINLSGSTGTAVITTFGGDLIQLGAGPATVFGGAGDTILAGSGQAVIDGRPGNASITIGSSGGSDTILSGTGDTILGGAANATVIGARGDTINLSGGTGGALINAVAGNEVVSLGNGAATVFGGAGDTVTAGSGAAAIIGTDGNMSITIGSSGGSDTIFSGPGDTIHGGAAAATVFGASGDTIDLSGGPGTALINAAAGNEGVTLGGGAGTVFAGAGDTVSLGFSSSALAIANAANVSIQIGSTGSDTVFSGPSRLPLSPNDTITAVAGGSANATIFGSIGDNINLTGSNGTALVNALAGEDTVTLGNGAATVFGKDMDLIRLGASSSALAILLGGVVQIGSGSDTVFTANSNSVGAQTGVGGSATLLLGSNNDVNLAEATGSVVINALAGGDRITLGSGAATVFGAAGASISGAFVDAGAASAALIDATPGFMKVILGSTGSDTVFAGAGDTITGASGGTANATVIGAANDSVNLTGWNGNAVINASQGTQSLTLGRGAATVFGGAGDTIATGLGTSTIVDDAIGQMSVQLGASGMANITDTHRTGTPGDTITAASGSAANATINLASGDSVNLSGGNGSALINALAGNDTITLGSGDATVFAAQADSVTGGFGSSVIAFGAGAVNVSLPGGHGAATIGDVGTQGTDTVTGFAQGQDLIFFQGAHAGGLTPTQNLLSATSTTVNGTASTVLTFPDGTQMTLVGYSPSQINDTFFK